MRWCSVSPVAADVAGPAAAGGFLGATIVCAALDDAVALYCEGLGFRLASRGRVASGLAAAWGAPGVAGARFAVLVPASGAACHLRFIEQPQAAPARPWTSTGWMALEFCVASSDAAMARLARAGFEIIGGAQDLEFSQGALRAGQVRGPFGEQLYLTEVRRQIDGYSLPRATCEVDGMFIAILATRDLDGCMKHYQRRFGCLKKDVFKAAVPFIARAQGLSADHEYEIGTVELQPGNYIEMDAMPLPLPDRTAPPHRQPGLLPAGIALVSLSTPALSPYRQHCLGTPVQMSGTGDVMAVAGYHEELVELVASPDRP